MSRLGALAIAIWSTVALALTQINTTSTSGTGAYDEDSLLCNHTFARANATGVFYFDPGVPQGRSNANDSGFAPEAAWAVAIASNTNNQSNNYGIQYNLLYSSGGANYSDDVHLGYDACAVFLDPTTLLDNTILRAQSDNGSCLQTFDGPCIDAMIAAANSYTSWIDTPSPRPNSNLTSTSLPTVCDKISQLLAQNIPSQCTPFFNGTTWIASNTALTEYNNNGLSGLAKDCPVNGTDANAFKLYWNPLYTYADDDLYDSLVYQINPILTIFMPTANADVSSSNQDIVTSMTCAHIDTYSSGSRVAPALDTPTPVDYGTSGTGLSKGAIAGIVVGSIIGCSLILLTLLVFLNCFGLRRRLLRSGRSFNGSDHKELAREEVDEIAAYKTATNESGGAQINELSPQSMGSAELPQAKPRAELRGTDRLVELSAEEQIAEMSGDMPSKSTV